jgi:hypothetical protein
MQAGRTADREAFNSLKLSLDANTAIMKEFAGWRPQVDSKVGELQESVKALRTKIYFITQKQEEEGNPSYKVFQYEDLDFTKPATTPLVASPSGATSGQIGHGDDTHHWGTGHGVVTTLIPPPVKGMNKALDLTPVPYTMSGVATPPSNSVLPRVPLGANLPQISFPEFDGSSPKLWKKKCGTYFEIYAVPVDFQVKLATMYFIGPAMFWLQSLEDSVSVSSWEELCLLVCKCFDRD